MRLVFMARFAATCIREIVAVFVQALCYTCNVYLIDVIHHPGVGIYKCTTLRVVGLLANLGIICDCLFILATWN